MNYALSLSETTTENSFKYMRYSYDLISGKVKEVAYQPGKGDQFYHRYLYDADDRLKIVLTSHNGLTWEKDAKYFYYKHGPLSRTELGEDKVQGVDYAYTINGWLKGINASTLNTSRDMGKDASLNNKNGYIGKDAMGYSLGYYDGDYKAIDNTSSWEATTVSTPLSSGAYRNLYNGNIPRTVSSFMDVNEAGVATMGKAYSYDQLNRIKTANSFTHVSGGDQVLANNSFSGASDNETYAEDFSYDQNGNITDVDRYGNNAGSKMDEMSYNYQSGSNKLTSVNDSISNGNYGDDIDNQSTNNYTYWENGDLKTDASEQLSIEWNVYGKIRKINRTGGTKASLEFTYDASGNRLSKIVKPAGQDENYWTYTYYTRDAQGNVMAVYDRKVEMVGGGSTVADRYSLKEHHVYGSSRLGIEKRSVALGELVFFNSGMSGSVFTRPSSGTDVIHTVMPENRRVVGDKHYELSNHLGNVMVAVSDKKLGVDADNAGTEKQAESYTADVVSSQDYYAFGAVMPGRGINSSADYRFAFGSQEKDDEIYGKGNSYTAEFWQYDPRLGRRWNRDPIVKPWESSYAAFNDNPIYYRDPLGLNGEGPGDKKKGTEAPTTGTWETHHEDGTYTGKTAPPTDLNEIVIKPSPSSEVKTPTPAPTEVLGTVGYYKYRQDDFVKRNPGATPPSYYMNYGDKYARRFSNELNPKLTQEGQEWLMKARLNLQMEMENKLQEDPQIELDNSKFQKFAFDSHVKAYVDAGVLKLGFGDKVLILSTPDAEDLLSDLGRQQAMQMAVLQIQYYIDNPGVLMQHLENIPEDAIRVGSGAVDDMIKKTVTP